MEPLEIHVRVSPDDEVLALRAQVAELKAALVAAEAERDRAAYLHRCECIAAQELADLCRAHGIRYRASLDWRPK